MEGSRCEHCNGNFCKLSFYKKEVVHGDGEVIINIIASGPTGIDKELALVSDEGRVACMVTGDAECSQYKDKPLQRRSVAY